MTTMTHHDSRKSLQAVAELIGRLLLREVDAAELERLREPALMESLATWGVELPGPDEEAVWLEARGADYHDLFLRPEQGPLVQSLWTQGRYEGDSTIRVRQLAELAGVEFVREAARGAAPDHLGSLLLLWAATDEVTPEVAGEIASVHFEWATVPLQRVQAAGGFYGAVARVALELTNTLRDGTKPR